MEEAFRYHVADEGTDLRLQSNEGSMDEESCRYICVFTENFVLELGWWHVGASTARLHIYCEYGNAEAKQDGGAL